MQRPDEPARVAHEIVPVRQPPRDHTNIRLRLRGTVQHAEDLHHIKHARACRRFLPHVAPRELDREGRLAGVDRSVLQSAGDTQLADGAHREARQAPGLRGFWPISYATALGREAECRRPRGRARIEASISRTSLAWFNGCHTWPSSGRPYVNEPA